MINTDTYLGDALYASFDGYQVELYASNGIYKTNSVFLDPQVVKAFIAYLASLKQAESTSGARRCCD